MAEVLSPSLQTENDRFHGLDAARSIALLVGVFHHGIESLVSYVKSDWITQDFQSSIVLDILFYASHVFRMQAFFLMSGFFVHLLINKKGLQAFIINRTKRLVIPFLIFWPILYAVIYSMWVWGIQYTRHLPYEQAVAQVPRYMIWSNGFPLMHLWFLYFLILYCALTAIIQPLTNQWLDRKEKLTALGDRFLAAVMQKWWGGLVIGIFMVFPMWGMTDWFGVDTSESGLMPRPFPFIIYGMYFTLGWMFYRQMRLMENMNRFRHINLGIGLALIFLLIVLSLLFSEPGKEWARLVLMGLNTIYAFATITTVFAFLGYMQVVFAKPSKSIRYLSDSAYWGYLIHLPIIGLFQILVVPYDWFWGIKLLAIFTPSILILYLSYHFGVRNTFIGVLLNGKKK